MTTEANLTTGDDLVHRTCPGCGSENDSPAFAVKAPVDPEGLGRTERTEYWRGFRSRSCFFSYVRCGKCQLLYCPTYFSESALSRLYSSMPDNTAGASPEVLLHTQNGYIDFLIQQRRLQGTYLEIGPDIGLAAAAARIKGSLDRMVLVEPNVAVHEDLRAAAAQVPVTVVSVLEELDDVPKADNAVLVHVLDHLTDPVAFLIGLREQLSTDARVLVVVHNEASVLRRLLGVRWPPFTLQHPQLFSPTTLRTTMNAAGFKIIAERPTTNVFPAQHIVRTAGALVGVKGRWINAVPNWRVRIRLGNIMAVAK